MLNKSYMYLILTVAVGVAALIIIPKKHYKHYFLYGLVFGGIGDIIISSILTVSGLINYKNMGPFNILGLFSLWTPIAWMFVFAIFYFLLPVKRGFLYPYLLAFAGLNYGAGLSMENFGLFEFNGITNYIAPINFFIWYSVSAWAYFKIEGISLK